MDNGRVCPQCGRSNSSTVKFCENCGYAFPAEAADPNAANAAAQQGGFNAAPQQNSFNAAPQQNSFNAAPQQGGFNAAPQQNSFNAAPQQNSFNAAPQQNSFNAAPQQNSFNAAPQQNSFNAAPQQNSFNAAPQQNSFNAAPQNNFAQAPAGGAAPKKGKGGVVAAIIVIAVLLIGGVTAAGFALGWFGGTKTIEVSPSKLSIEVGEEATVEISNYDDLKKVRLEYTSDDKDVVEIVEEYDDGFKVEGVGEGKTTITISGKGCESVTIKVTVKEAAPEPTPEPEPTEAPEVTEVPEPTEKPEPTERPEPTTTSAGGSTAMISAKFSSDTFTIYVPDGYTLDQDQGDFLEFENDNGDYFWVYGDLPYNAYYTMHPDELSDDSDPIPDNYSFDYDVVLPGGAPNGEDIYVGYCENPDDEYGYTELYYIFFPYDDSYGTQDYITVEITPELGDRLDEDDIDSFFYGF